MRWETSRKATADAAGKGSELGGSVLQKGQELGQGAAEQTGLKGKD
jgi:hypothetical protein